MTTTTIPASHLLPPLERMRRNIEEIEALEVLIQNELESNQRPNRSHRRRLASEHRVLKAVNEARERAKEVKKLRMTPATNGGDAATEYRHRNGGTESSSSSSSSTSSSSLDTFLTSVRAITELHHNNPAALDYTRLDALVVARGLIQPYVEDLEVETEKNRRLREDEIIIEALNFSGEEHSGRFLDLLEYFSEYQNAQIAKEAEQKNDATSEIPQSYLDFLKALSRRNFQSTLPKALVQRMVSYLDEFEKRAKPLLHLRLEERDGRRDDALVDALEDAQSAEELERYGLEGLKTALRLRGLKMGGNVKQRAERLFAVKGLREEDYPPELKAPITSSSTTGGENANNHNNDTTAYETLNAMLGEGGEEGPGRLHDVLVATQRMVVKRLTMTYEEVVREFQMQDDEEGEEEDDEEGRGARRGGGGGGDDAEGEDEDEGWGGRVRAGGYVHPVTGKVIPKWMYRMLGLHREFRCEVCGGEIYFGRQDFARHFQDYRHANGMRALGVPNTRHFHNVSKVSEVMEIYERLKKELPGGASTADLEQFEDSQGNVLSRKEMEDLRREGLL